MQAITITQPGGPEVLQITERPIPQPQPGEVLIKVAAAGINRPDVAQRKGLYAPPPGAPDILGLEVAGTITALGESVKHRQIGDTVCALVSGGGYAQYCTAPEGQCLPIPQGLSFAEAASLPETYFTVWSNLFDRAKLTKGETLLVHGGTSGIGVAAIQMAKAMGCDVYITAGSDEKCKFCVQLGATRAINYKTENFAQVIKDATQGKGVNVILDMVGGDYTPDNVRSLAFDGRLVIISALKGKEGTLDLNLITHKRLTITGSALRARDTTFKSAIAQNLQQCIWPLLASGQIKPIVYKTFPLAQVADAHRLMESSEHIGKIVLTME
jgi:NADPH2:quinone reductase